MKKAILLSLILILLFIGLNKKSYASHFAGADLTYLCLGGNDYRITLAFYRDCSGIDVSATASISFTCSSISTYNFTVNLSQIAGTGLEVTPGCSAMPTSCITGSTGSYGLREFVYRGQVTLPPCNAWTMSYTSSARNPSNTILNPTSQSWFVMAYLNNAQAPCNSSPQFSNKPLTIMCSGQTFCYNHGAIDPDGDSLSYEFYTPMTTSPTATVTYIAGYSYTQPVPSNPPVSLNGVTGDICMTPTVNIISPMGIMVKEWRKINGVVTNIGRVYRDMQVNVVTCNNTLPILGGMDTLLSNHYNYSPLDTTYFLEKCLGFPINFNIYGHDADTFNPSNIGHPEKMFISWNNGIPAGTFSLHNNGTDSAWANFSWTPTAADVSNTPKCFTAIVHDDACPYNGTQAFSYCITVRGMEVKIGSDTLLCKGESLNLIALGDSTTVNYRWFVDGNPQGSAPYTDSTFIYNTIGVIPGIHHVTIKTDDGNTTTQCPGMDSINVNVVYQPHVNLGNDTLICEGNSITLDAGPGSTYYWTPGNVFTQTLTISNPPGATYIVSVDGGNGTRCTDADTILVQVIPMPVFDLGPDTCVMGSSVDIKSGLSSPWVHAWNTGSTDSTINISTSGTYSVTITGAAGSGCEKTDSKVVNIVDPEMITPELVEVSGNSTPLIPLSPGKYEICSHQSIKLNGPLPPTGHNYTYDWELDKSNLITTPFAVYSKIPAGDHTITLILGSGNGCEETIDLHVKYCEVDIPNIITPNGDGFNDKFAIMLINSDEDFYKSYPNSTMIIFNRWGKKVFESSNYQNDWDAKNDADGVYYYVFKLEDGLGTEYNGSITVIKK